MESADREIYSQLVESLFKTDSTELISNGAPLHAAILYEKFFQHAKASVVIFCKKLASEVFTEPLILSQAERALARGVSIRVVTQDEEVDKNIFSEWIKEKANTDERVSCLSGQHVAKIRDIEANFTVMDGRAYRLEKERGEIKATACVNDPVLAEKLTAIFEKIVGLAKR